MSNLIPDGWDSKKLIDCSANGISNGVFCDPKKVGSGYKLINVYEMYQGYGVDVNLTRRLQLDEKEFLKNKVNYGDVFFTRSSLKLDGIAYCNINLSHDNDITYDGHLMKIVPDENVVHPEYLARYCLSDFARTYFMSTAKHSTMTTIAQADIAPLRVLLPPLPEQQKIAAILTSVDDVIEKTQVQIDKLKDLKTGMMQELLTRGVGVGGKPHTEFKDSPVGRIPKGWRVVPLESVVQRIIDCEHKTAPYVDKSDFMVVRTSNVRNGELVLDGMKYTHAKGYTEWTTRAIPSIGDVLFTREAPAGESCLVPEGVKVCMGQRIVLLRPNLDVITPHFFSLFLISEAASQTIYKLSIGTTVSRINIEDIRRIPCIVPPLSEQQQISTVIQSIQNSILKKQEKLKSVIDTKKALMQDLLTGKVRVKVDN
ncbi:MAG: type I restriction enzyme S subunit [Cocleimonas sp.]|jgi:type I restriction enzyme S subunit